MIRISQNDNEEQQLGNNNQIKIKILIVGLLVCLYLLSSQNRVIDEPYYEIYRSDDQFTQISQIFQTQTMSHVGQLRQHQQKIDDRQDRVIVDKNNKQQFRKMIENRKMPKYFTNIPEKIYLKQLPLCFVGNLSLNSKQKYKSIKSINFNYNPQTNLNLTHLNQLITKQCDTNSIVLFTSKVPGSQFINWINQKFQTKQIWTLINIKKTQFQVVGCYHKILQLVQNNNFPQLGSSTIINHKQLIMKIISLSLDHLHVVNTALISMLNLQYQIFAKQNKVNLPLNSLRQFQGQSKTMKLQFLKYQKKLEQQYSNTAFKNEQFLTNQMKRDAIDYLQLLYLPKNHSLADRQKQYFQKKYKISQYQKQLPLCIFVPSHNNIPNNRYEKSMLSIFQQQYQNYHIVFLDDVSDDLSLKKTIQLASKYQFPSQRITYIQNLKRNYATYNIVNAAFNYCQSDEIMVLVDGDDQLIGRQVFKFINYGYQKRDNWLIYTSMLSSQYNFRDYPILKQIKQKSEYLGSNGVRKFGHRIGHLTTFKVDLFRRIKLSDHQCLQGFWLDTLYDDAMQHPLLEMCSIQHIQLMPQIVYWYNTLYGDNDDSTNDKVNYRMALYNDNILKRTPYRPLQQLDGKFINNQIEEELEKDRNIKYKQIYKLDDIQNLQQQLQLQQQQQAKLNKPNRCKQNLYKISKYYKMLQDLNNNKK